MRYLLLLIWLASCSTRAPQQQEVKQVLPVRFLRDASGITAISGDRKILRYLTAPAKPPPDSPSYYQRSGFIHPIYSVSGQVLTDDFPLTHAHQHGLFHAWADARFRNSHVDFWNQFKQEGTVIHDRILEMKERKDYADLTTQQIYTSTQFGAILREQWHIRIYATPPDHFIFDISIDQLNITSDTLFLNGYIYGGLAFRGSARWDPDNAKSFQNPWMLLSSEGLRDSTANHQPAKWVTVSGRVDGVDAFITVFDHPANFRYPQKVRVHPRMPYWAYSPVVDGPFIIPPGGRYRARYRFCISSKFPGQDSLKRLHEKWISL